MSDLAQRRDPLSTWTHWVLATAIGEFVGFAVPASVGAIVAQWQIGRAGPLSPLIVPLAVTVAGAMEGLCLGYAQWRVLRRIWPAIGARAWIRPTMIAAVIAYLLGFVPSTLMDLTARPDGSPGISMGWMLAVGILVGIPLLLSIGYAQWRTLRHHTPGATSWITYNALGWLLGLVTPIGGMMLVPDGSSTAVFIITGVFSGLLMGAAMGAVTGIGLIQLLRRPTNAL